MRAPSSGVLPNSAEGERKGINSQLWHACAGPLVSLPPVGSLVVYFPQGHSEQVAASMQKQADFIPSYPNLPSKLICLLHNVTLHADPETDEVYAQMTLQPVNKYDKEALLASDMGLKQNNQPTEFFCKTLTASDTSTHGGFSVPRRAAEKIFPPLDFSMQPPAQEIVAKDLHDNTWTFRHIYRGQPKRHLLTTGWSVFVSTKRLFAGDSVLFVRDEKSQLLLGIRRANRQTPALSSSVISSDSMHIGILAAAAHAAANNSPFTIFYNPRASSSEFVVPLAKYNKAMYTQVSLGMRFRMMFETEDCGVRRYMGTITGISDLDPVRWKNSQWRNLQVGWDESTAGERPSRVSIWDIEPVITPFYICPPPFFRPKFPRQPGMPDDEFDMENAFKRAMPWLGDEYGMKDAQSSMFPGLSLVQWMSMQQNNPLSAATQFPSMLSSYNIPNNFGSEDASKLLNFQTPSLSSTNLHFNKTNVAVNQMNQLQQSPIKRAQQPPQQQLPMSHQQGVHSGSMSNGVAATNEVLSHNMHQANGFSQSQLQQQALLSSGSKMHSNTVSGLKGSSPLTSLAQDFQFQQQMEQQNSGHLLRNQQEQVQPAVHPLQQGVPSNPQQPQMQQLPKQSLSQQQIQLQLLQTLQQQQQQQSIPPVSSSLQPHTSLLQQPQNHQMQQILLPQNQQPAHGNNNFSASMFMQPPQTTVSQPQGHTNKPIVAVRTYSGQTDGEAPSCSTSPSANNNGHVSPSNFLSRNSQGPPLCASDSPFEPANHAVQELYSKTESRIKQDLVNLKSTEQFKYKGTMADQLDVSTSGTTYCPDVAATPQPQHFSLPSFGLDGDAQSHPRSNLPYAGNLEGVTSDALYSQKDLHNLVNNYGGTPRDIETELSSAAISSQSFGIPNIPFKPGCSNDLGINDPGILNTGIWANQTQRMRTYTKVQKRGSVGRSIDVTRYRGYDDLRRDLARMFGIEGQLEDPQTSDWKLVYTDHEKDILLVGDDPWEEFVNCVQNIKILSSAEVQQMSMDGDLAAIPVPNQACSETDSGNAWKVHYDDTSAASFNR